MTQSHPDPVATNDAAPQRQSTSAHHSRRHHGHAAHHHGGSFHKHVAAAHHPASSRIVAPEVKEALHAAMAKEGVPNTWEQGLQFIMERESSGRVGVMNNSDSARGLFQLTKASYHLNPSGAQSFGNAVEEAQGGIRYIQQRYQTADNAMQFWQRHGWY